MKLVISTCASGLCIRTYENGKNADVCRGFGGYADGFIGYDNYIS